jgi:hypothetical protein
MEGIWLVFLVVLAVNLLPVFAPPTWLVLSFFSYKFPDNDIAMLALVGAHLTTLELRVLGLPFFLGRLIGYNFWATWGQRRHASWPLRRRRAT